MKNRPRKRWRAEAITQQLARGLRRRMTPTEWQLWRHLRDDQLNGLRFRRQHPIGRFIVDFYCARCKLVIEIDGDTHASLEEYDKRRTRWLEFNGCRVLRFTNREVRDQLPAALDAISVACEESTSD